MRIRAFAFVLATLTVTACDVGNNNHVECAVSATCPNGTSCQGGFCNAVDAGAVEGTVPDATRRDVPRSDAVRTDVPRRTDAILSRDAVAAENRRGG